MNTRLVDKEILQSNINITKDKLANMELANLKDVELTNVEDGQIVKYNATTQKWENADAVNPTQFATMPTAADYPEAIVQYIGADTATYKRGMFYRSNPSVVSGSVVYTWEQTDVQPSNSDYEQLSNHPEIENVELVGNKTLDDLGINGKFQYSTLPTATVSNAGKIVQYIGTTTADYKKGYWYQSAYDSETSEYVWKNIDVSSNTQLATRIAQLETNQGDMSQLEVVGVSDIVAALNALNGKGLSTITYTEPNLILTYEDGTTKTFNVRDSILNETQIGELANVTDTTVANGNVLQYDSAILGYKPYDILTALTTLLTESKDYTDQEIASSLTASAYVCDAKPQYDSVNDLVIYFQNGQAHTTDKTDSRFYYTTSDGSFCSSWIEGTEFTFNVAQVDYDDYVNKNTDVVSTYTEDMADKSKIPDVSALDALLAIVKTALALKVNTSSIIDALTSQDATKVLSANQGYVIKGLIDDKNDKIQFATMPTPASALSGIVYQYVGSSSQAFVKGHFYTCLYDNVNDTWYWSEIKYAADTDNALDPTSKNPVANDALCEEFDKKQDKDLETPIEVDGTEQTTVEDALSALNTYAAKKVDQLNSLPVASADTLGMLVQYKGATTSTLKHAFFYECKVVEGSDPTEYEWVDAGIGGEDLSQYKKIFSGTSAEWDALPLEDKITYDYIMPDDDGETGDITDVVESGNHNAVESDAVYNSEQEIYEVMGKMGAKNLLPNIATSESYASSGTVTKNVNGSLTINGTFDAVTTINIDYLNGLSNAVFDVTDLIGTDIVVSFLDTAVSGITLEVGYFNSAGTRISLEGGVSTKANITFPAGAVKSATYLRIASGTYDNVTVYPMMQLASDTDSTYEPYAKTNQELTAENEALTNQANDMVNVLGAKNLLPFPYYNTSKTQDGITWTVNSDGSISASGTATANSFFRITQDSDLSIYNNTILSGCPANGEMWSKWALYLSGNKDGQSVTKIDVGSGVLIEDIPAGYSGGLYAKVINGQTVNFTFKPMIRLASDPDNTYQPYAMTNQQLTRDKADKVSSATAGNFAGLDASGNLTDSGKKASDFATATALTDEIKRRFTNNCKNVLPIRIANQTARGVTFTRNVNDSYSLSGTCTGNPLTIDLFSESVYTNTGDSSAFKIEKGIVIDKTKPYILTRGDTQIRFTLALYQDGVSVATVGFDSTGGNPFMEIDFSSYTFNEIKAVVRFGNNTSYSNKTFTPMLCLKSDYQIDSSQQYFAKTNKQLTDDSVDWESNSVLGAKNFLTNKGTATTQGVEFAVDSNGVFTVTRKSAGSSHAYYSNGRFTLKPGTYIFSNGYNSLPSGIQATYLYNHTDGAYFINCNDGPKTFTITEEKELAFNIEVQTTQSPSGVKIYPMIRLASDNDATYQPYAKTNRELTKDVASIMRVVNVSDVSIFDIISDLNSYPAKTEYYGYTASITNGSSTLGSLLNTGDYGVVSIKKYSEWHITISIISGNSNGKTHMACTNKNNTSIKFVNNDPAASTDKVTSTTINKATT